MNPILYSIYQFLKGLTKLSFWLYYPNADLLGMQHLKYKGGSILVSNHPNTLIDPLNAASRVPKVVHFLANASLFGTPFTNWFFNTFFCIPVERPQDTKGKPINNQAAFAKSHAFLARGGCLFIAPEGGSEMERRVRPFKTGAARIALGAEAKADFKLGLRILPVGLSYEHAERFRSHMVVNACEPILVSEYADLYRENSIAAARKLTEDLEKKVRNAAIDTESPEEDKAVLAMEQLLRNNQPVPGSEHFKRTKKLIEAYREWATHAPEKRTAFDSQLETYQAQLQTLRTTDKAVARPQRLLLLRVLAFSLLAPFFVYGFINNLLPFAAVWWVDRKLDLYIGYQATVRILAGLLFFPIVWAIQAIVVAQFCPYAWWYLLSLPLAGYIALRYWEGAAELLANLRLRNPVERQNLQQIRTRLFASVQKLLDRQN